MVFDMSYSREDYNNNNTTTTASNNGNSEFQNLQTNYIISNSKDLHYSHNLNENNNASAEFSVPSSLPNANQLFNFNLINTPQGYNTTNHHHRYNQPSYYPSSILEPIGNHNSSYDSIVPGRRSSTLNPFPAHSLTSPTRPCPNTSNLRFEAILEAQTAAAQRIDESSLTYLNKSQLYGITLNDHEKYDGDLTSTIRITFHDENHRRMAGTYWSFWLTQQQNPKSAKALSLDRAAASNISNEESKSFDRVQFDWNGAKGAKIYIKFNCLSTDFSRVKGVKGIPLRVQLITKAKDYAQGLVEYSCCKIKLFRDKGAERKNKDDQRHLDKVWEKMKGKTNDNSPLLMMFAPVSPVTVFSEMGSSSGLSLDSNSLLDFEEDNTQLEIDRMIQTGQIKNKKFNSQIGEFPELLDVDPSYMPQQRKRKKGNLSLNKVLSVYIKFFNESLYRAIYLDELSVKDLIRKVSDKLQVPFESIINVYRVNKKGIDVSIDDSTIQQMEDEQDMIIEYEFHNNDSSMLNLTLKF